MVLATAMLGLAGSLASELGTEFIPRLNEHSIVIATTRLASVSLPESVRYGTQIEKLLLENFREEIEHVWTRTGTAEVATDPMGWDQSDVFITLTPGRRMEARAPIRTSWRPRCKQLLAGLPGMQMLFTQPIEQRINEMIAGIRGDVGVKIFGDDFDRLTTYAREVADGVGKDSRGGDVGPTNWRGCRCCGSKSTKTPSRAMALRGATCLARCSRSARRAWARFAKGKGGFRWSCAWPSNIAATPKPWASCWCRRPAGPAAADRLAQIEQVETPSVDLPRLEQTADAGAVQRAAAATSARSSPRPRRNRRIAADMAHRATTLAGEGNSRKCNGPSAAD